MSLYAIIVGTLFDVVFPGSSPFQLRAIEILASSGASLGCRIVNAAPEYLLGRQRLIPGVMNNRSRTWSQSRSQSQFWFSECAQVLHTSKLTLPGNAGGLHSLPQVHLRPLPSPQVFWEDPELAGSHENFHRCRK